MIDPIADAAAVPEPEILPNNILAITLVCANAPGVRPVTNFARLINLTAIPPLFMIFPAKIKNGIANKLNTEIPENILWAPVNTATFKSMIGRIAHTDEIPSATAIGTPAINITTNRTKIIAPETIAILIIHFPP